MSKLIVSLIAVVALVLGGCAASKEEMVAYYTSVDVGNLAIVESIESQAEAERDMRQQSMVFFGQAMVEAAKTEDPTDNAVIAFAWGYQSGQRPNITAPPIKFPATPTTSVDALRAWTPIIGMAVPFITPLIYGWSGAFDNSGTTISADNGARVNLDSQNAGSYNKSSGDMSTTVNQDSWDNSNSRDRIGENTDEGGTGIDTLPDGEFVLAECIANPPGGYSASGTPLWTSSPADSCTSYAATL